MSDTNETATEQLGDAGKKALEAERDARKKAEARVKELEATISTHTAEIEALNKQHAEALGERETALTTAKADLARSEVLRAKKVPDNLARFITGNTVEEMEAAADELLAAIPQPEPTAKADTPKMTPDPLQGGSDAPLNGDDLALALAAAVGA